MQVHIRIVGTQAFDGQTDRITQQADGRLSLADGTATLVYDERDEDGACTTVTVTAREREVTVHRCGAATAQLRMRRGERCHSIYGTPYGNFEVTTFTHLLRSTLGEAGGELSLAYTLSLGGQDMENTLCMTIERIELQ